MGSIYVYERDEDRKKLNRDELQQIMLFKVGRTIKTPQSRVGHQAVANGESYTIRETFKTKFNKFVEYAVHRMFQDQRVVKTDSCDGKTEWFLVDY